MKTKKVINKAFLLSNLEHRSLDDQLQKLMEEVGELFVERLIEKGQKNPKSGGKDGVRGECVDVAIMAMSIFVSHGGNLDEFKVRLDSKLKKWECDIANRKSHVE